MQVGLGGSVLWHWHVGASGKCQQYISFPVLSDSYLLKLFL